MTDRDCEREDCEGARQRILMSESDEARWLCRHHWTLAIEQRADSQLVGNMEVAR